MPVLHLLISDAPYWVEADASGCALGAVLSQCQDSKWVPIAFLSKSLDPTQRNFIKFTIERCQGSWLHLNNGDTI